MPNTDFLMPGTEPARSLYQAFAEEATKRDERHFEDWHQAECEAVHNAAADQAGRLGLRAPTLDEVIKAEQEASGSSDYGAKWAYGVVDEMYPRRR